MPVLENLVWPLVVAALAALGGVLWQNWPTVRGWLKRHDIVAGDPRRFNVLVARLNGDDAKNSNRRHIVRSLRQQPGIEVVTDVKCFWEVEAGSDTDRVAEVRAAAQKRLHQTGCDIVVFGDVVAANQALYLHVLPTGAEGPGANTYALEGQKLELPQDFSPAFGEALAAAALTAAASAVDDEKCATYLVETLRPVRDKLKSVLDVPPAGMTDSMRATLQVSYGDCCSTLGEQTGDADILSEAVAAYRAALDVHGSDTAPEDWAMTQNNLGIALQKLGEWEEGTARLEEAVTAYRAALVVRTRERLPLDWAMTQNNLGTSLAILGEREHGTNRLNEALDAYRAVLVVHTRERLPFYWAMTQTNLGNALQVIGEQEQNTDYLDQALAVYEAALEVHTREGAPLAWATTQNNTSGIRFRPVPTSVRRFG